MSDEKEATLKTQLVAWVAGQPFNNVLLLAIFASIMYGTYFAMNTAIPSHLQQIQKGYESLTENHRDERRHTLEMYDRWINKTHIDAMPGSKVANQK